MYLFDDICVLHFLFAGFDQSDQLRNFVYKYNDLYEEKKIRSNS